ncbi:hypothetical protein GQX74_012323 [Glossina fuscipes]|nr:hypothetical protein GQX74_012323 [Glossina fuscipes]
MEFISSTKNYVSVNKQQFHIHLDTQTFVHACTHGFAFIPLAAITFSLHLRLASMSVEKHQTEAHVIEGVLKGKQNLKLTTATSDENKSYVRSYMNMILLIRETAVLKIEHRKQLSMKANASTNGLAGFESTQSKLCRTDMYFVAEHLILIYSLTSDSECAKINIRKRPQAYDSGIHIYIHLGARQHIGMITLYYVQATVQWQDFNFVRNLALGKV